MEQLQSVEGIGAISTFFGMPWPADALAAAYDQMSNEPIEAMVSAQKRVCLEFSPYQGITR